MAKTSDVKTAKNREARELLKTLTPVQLDEVGTMLGMSNCGMNRFGLMEEIKHWRKLLRNPREKWGWCDDLAEMAAEARKRYPSKA